MSSLLVRVFAKDKAIETEGEVAFGEQVAVAVEFEDATVADASTMRLRVRHMNADVAVFPLVLSDPEDDTGGDAWTPDAAAPAGKRWTATLNLNTVQLRAAFGARPCDGASIGALLMVDCFAEGGAALHALGKTRIRWWDANETITGIDGAPDPVDIGEWATEIAERMTDAESDIAEHEAAIGELQRKAMTKDMLRIALTSVLVPGPTATQKEVRLIVTALVNALKGLCLSVLVAFLMAGCGLAFAETLAWEDVPPGTEVDTDALKVLPETDPVWEAEKGGYATTGQVASAIAVAGWSMTNYTAGAVAALKSQVETGWWGKWTILRTYDGATTDVTAQVAQPVWTGVGEYAYDNAWLVNDIPGDVGPEFVIYGVAENDTSLNWEASSDGQSLDVTYTATRHRVSAPVPTKPEDIGAASAADATLAPIYSQTPTFSEWTYNGVPDGWIVETPLRLVTNPEILQYYNWEMSFFDGEASHFLYSVSATDSGEVVFENSGGSVVTATRTRTDIIGYTLGDQTGKPLQPKVDDMAAIRSGAALGAAAVQPGQRNLLDYATGTTLSPATAVYRASATLSGTDATIPTPDATAIPAANAYFCFELEVSVDATATSIAGPSGWTWPDGGELPTSGFAGATLYIACRMDCTTRSVIANVWRVEAAQ